jgi:hypothetical protein
MERWLVGGWILQPEQAVLRGSISVNGLFASGTDSAFGLLSL